MAEQEHHEHKEHEVKEHEHAEHHAHHEAHSAVHKPKQDFTWQIVSGILAVVLVISIITGGFGIGKSSGSGEVTGALSDKEAVQKTLDYVNKNLLQPGMTATSGAVEDANGLYKVKLNIGGREFDSYVTKDASLLFPQAVDMTKEVPAQPEAPAETVATKSDKPTVELYVMSFCPFGNQAEDTMYPVYQLLKDKVEWNVHYIVSVDGTNVRSLHGQPETDQNIREVCVKRDYGMDAFWKFMTYVNTNCGRDGSCWKDAAKAAGADSTKIQSCFDKDGLTLMKAEAAASEAAGANGSPTLVINGAQSSSVYKYGQSETYKQTICSAFNIAPSECEQALGSAESASAGGSCG